MSELLGILLPVYLSVDRFNSQNEASVCPDNPKDEFVALYSSKGGRVQSVTQNVSAYTDTKIDQPTVRHKDCKTLINLTPSPKMLLM